MKMYPILAVMGLVVLAGCSNNEFEEGPAVAAGETPIIIRTGVATKAVVATGNDVTATFALISSQTEPKADAWNAFVPRKANTLTELGAFADYKADAANVSTGIFEANATEAQAISFNPALYYNKTDQGSNDFEKAYLVGVAPSGTVVTGGTLTFSVKDGEQDIMYASQIDKGIHSEAQSNANVFTFNHQTGQVSFSVKKEEKLTDLVTVKSIKLKSVQLPASIKLADGAVTYDNPADLTLPNVINSQAVTVEGVATGNPVMIAPIAALTIDVTISIKGADKTYTNVPVTFTDEKGTGVTKGNASLVTILVKEPATSTEVPITATATVVAWGTGNSGKVDLN